jgi:NAD(P)-dependent dehydrogenase (short-subunit alcohol dehydrogenase family)
LDTKPTGMQRIVWITGGTGNLGRAQCRRFSAAGDHVIATTLPGEAVPDPEQGVRYQQVDLLYEPATEAAVGSIQAEYGRIDVAVLTAGGFAMGDIASTSLDDLHQMIRLNVDTTYTAARAVFRQMMAQGNGRLFMVGARPGLDMRDGVGMTAYAMSKSLVFRLAELLNQEAAGTDVVVTVVVPSVIDTPPNRRAMPEADFTAWVRPENIAELIHYHSSPAAADLRDTVLRIYGKC